MSILERLFSRRDDRTALVPLYSAIIGLGRQPHWYAQGQVPDTLDGRFDMLAAILALILLRLEGEDAARVASVQLTELFVTDMDGQLREIGIGDMLVGKHIGKMMSALGGRLSAYREALAPGGDLPGALVRNLYRGEGPAPDALAHVAARLNAFAAALEPVPTERLLAGDLPAA